MFDRKKQIKSNNQIPYHDDAGSLYGSSPSSNVSSNREEYFPWRLFQTPFKPVTESPELNDTQAKSGTIWGPQGSAGHHE